MLTPLRLHQARRLRVELEPRQHLLVADAAARVAVHDVDELFDRALAVADDVTGDALRDGDELAADDEHAVVEAGEECLDDDATRVFARFFERDFHIVVGLQVERHAAAVIGVERFDDDWPSEAVCGADGAVGRANDVLARDRQAEVVEDVIRLFLVGGDRDRDVARLARDRRLNALLVFAVTELNERGVVQTEPRDFALLGRADERACRRAELASLREVDELAKLGLEVERLLAVARLRPEVRGEQTVEETHREVGGRFADALFFELEDDVVVAGRPFAARFAEGDVRAGEDLQLDRDVLEDVTEPRAFAVLGQALDEAAFDPHRAGVRFQARKLLEQTADEARNLGARPLLEDAEVHGESHHREMCVKTGPAVNPTLENLHRLPSYDRLPRPSIPSVCSATLLGG